MFSVYGMTVLVLWKQIQVTGSDTSELQSTGYVAMYGVTKLVSSQFPKV